MLFNVIRLISLLISITFILLTFLILLLRKVENIYIFDIDNTICDTWKSLPRKKTKDLQYIINENKRIYDLNIFAPMQKYIQDLKSDKKNIILFLSMRPIYLLFNTIKYMNKNRIRTKFSQVLLVNEIRDKIIVLKIINKLFKAKVIYYDDLSYNHEYGKILFYNDIIEEIKKIDIVYYGYDDIQKFHN